MFKGFSQSVIGASHTTSGTVCQDSSAFKITDKYSITVVADGHGSKKHFRSNIGSKLAVEAAIETIDKFYEDSDEFEKCFPSNHDKIIKNIEKQIISSWNSKITCHLEENPITKTEKNRFTDDEFDKIAYASYYGTTLIIGVAGRKFTFGMQIGDGSLVALFDDGIAVMPMEYEESAPANITASMCNDNAVTMFNSFYVGNKTLFSMFASTDGLYTSFGSDVDFLDYHTIITSQLEEINGFESAVIKNITKRTHFGTQDDISLSCIYKNDMSQAEIQLIKNKVSENKKTAASRKANIKANSSK